MNDFINKEKEKEIINQVLDFLYCDIPSIPISEYLEDEIKNINKNYKDIGLKDINGKSIYADSSIVEFQLKHDVIFADFTGSKPTIWNEIKMIGYFVFNNEDLRYEIDIVDWEKNKTKSNFVCLYYNLETMSQFKIIDTIQENKYRYYSRKQIRIN